MPNFFGTAKNYQTTILFIHNANNKVLKELKMEVDYI